VDLPKGNVKPVGLNDTQGSLLGFLHSGPMTGWDLIEAVNAGLRRFWNVTTSHVYRELKVLEERKLVRAGASGPRDRRPYAITAAGRRAFARWIAQPPGPEQMRIPLLVTLWFGEHLDPAVLCGFRDDARADHEARLESYRAVLARVEDPYVAAVVRFGIRYEEAVLSWLDEVFGASTAPTGAAGSKRSAHASAP